MNLEQNLALVRRAKKSIEQGQLQKLLNRIISPLERATSNASDSGAASEYQNALNGFYNSAKRPVVNVFSPHDIQIMEAMNIAVSSGSHLSRLVSNIANDPSLIPNSKLSEFRNISQQIGSVVSRANKMEEVAAELMWDSLSGEEASPENFTAELTWYVPRSKTEHSLNQLKSEIKDFEMLVSSAGAISGNSNYKILYISASNFGFDIAAARETVDLIVGAISWVAGQYEKVSKAIEILGAINLTAKTKKEVEKELDVKDEKFLQSIAADALKAIAPEKVVDPEVANKFARSVSLAVHKLKDGFQIDAKYFIESDVNESPEDAKASSAQIADLVSKIEYLESALKHVPALPPPTVDPESASSTDPAGES